MDENPAVGTLQRMLRLLYCFTDQQPSWGVRELSRAVNLHHTTTHRLLKGLAAVGWLQFDLQTQRYSIGLELYRIGLKLASHLDIAAVARPHMKALAQLSRESVYLCLYVEERHELVIVEAVESDYPLRYVPELYRYLPLHAGATGRSILAFLPDEAVREVIGQTELKAATPNTTTDPDRLWDLLTQTREQGYARSFGERVPESAALGAPFRDASGKVRGSVVMVMPKFRWDQTQESSWAKGVIAAADAISRALGSSPPRTVGNRRY